MLNLTFSLNSLKLFFISGFFMSTIGAALGLVRVFGILQIFELIKPQLKQFSPSLLLSLNR